MPGHRPDRDGDDEEDEREGGQDKRQDRGERALCTQLDRIPLAIEAAAANTAVHSVAELAFRLPTSVKLRGGRGKVAMSADRNLKPTRNWRLLFLSTGEISARQKMEEEGDTPKAGQLLRLMDIPILKGVVQDPHGLEPAEYVNRLKSASSSYYGGAGPAFLEVLTQIAPDLEALKNFLTPKFERALDELAKADLEPEQ